MRYTVVHLDRGITHDGARRAERRLASGADLHASEIYDGAQPCSDLKDDNVTVIL